MQLRSIISLLVLLSIYTGVNARTQTVLVGGSSEDNRWQFLRFYPDPVYIHEGDDILWVLNSEEDHTVTFTNDAVLKLGAFIPELFLSNITSVVIPPVNATAVSNSVDSLNTTVWVVNPLMVKMGPTEITSENDTATSGLMTKKNESSTQYRLTFPVAGTFDYLCLFHAPGMTGSVIVLPSNSSNQTNQTGLTSADLAKLNSMEQLNESISLVPDLDTVFAVNNQLPSSRKNAAGNNNIWTVFIVNDGVTKGSLHRFVPSNFTVALGDTVEFVNADIRMNVIVAFNKSGDFSEPIIGGCLGGCPGEETNSTNATTPIVDPVYTSRHGGESYTGGFASSGFLFSRLNGPSLIALEGTKNANKDIPTNSLTLGTFMNVSTINPHFNSWNITFKAVGTFPYEAVFDAEEGMIGEITVTRRGLLCS